jgi:hypothetical protein
VNIDATFDSVAVAMEADQIVTSSKPQWIKSAFFSKSKASDALLGPTEGDLFYTHSFCRAQLWNALYYLLRQIWQWEGFLSGKMNGGPLQLQIHYRVDLPFLLKTCSVVLCINLVRRLSSSIFFFLPWANLIGLSLKNIETVEDPQTRRLCFEV